MVRAEITLVTDDCYDHPEDDFVRRCLYHIFFLSLSLLLIPGGHLVLVFKRLSYRFAYFDASRHLPLIKNLAPPNDLKMFLI